MDLNPSYGQLVAKSNIVLSSGKLTNEFKNLSTYYFNDNISAIKNSACFQHQNFEMIISSI